MKTISLDQSLPLVKQKQNVALVHPSVFSSRYALLCCCVLVFMAIVSSLLAITEQQNIKLAARLGTLQREHDALQSRCAHLSSDFVDTARRKGTAEPHCDGGGDKTSTPTDAEAPVPAAPPAGSTGETLPQSDLYTCRDEGMFSGAWLSPMQFFLDQKLVPANVEGATWSIVWPGHCLRTLDFLDFYVEHLSVYEQTLGVMSADDLTKAQFVTSVAVNLERHSRELAVAVEEAHFDPSVTSKVLCIVPFFGGALGGASHSLAATRLAYLDATIRSILPVFPHVVIGVLSESDLRLVEARHYTLFDTLLVTDLIEINDNLATATLLRAQQKLTTDERWKAQHFSHVYFSEGDQVLRIRSLSRLIGEATGNRILTPHRIMAVATPEDFPFDLEHSLRQLPPVDKFLTDASLKKTVWLEGDLEKTGSCCLKGINKHPDTASFWYFELGFSMYHSWWRQLGSLALMTGEQGHDHHGWTCVLTSERVKCVEPAE